jgi:hypothetical protein
MKSIVPVLLALTILTTLTANAAPVLSCQNNSASLEVIHENFGYRYVKKFEEHYERGALSRDLADRRPAMTFESDKAKIFHLFGEFRFTNKVTGQTESFQEKDCAVLEETSAYPLCEKTSLDGTAYVGLIRKNGKFFLHVYEAKGSVIQADYGSREVVYKNNKYTGTGIELHLFAHGMAGSFSATYGLSKLSRAHIPPGYGDRTVEYKNMSCN